MVNEKKILKLLEEMLSILSKYDKNDLRKACEYIQTMSSSANIKKASNIKQELIGKLPSILLNKEYFPTNDSLYKFANISNIKIPRGHKSRNELIGIIITDVNDMDYSRTDELVQAIDNITRRMKKGKVSNFIQEWEEVIKNLEPRRY